MRFGIYSGFPGVGKSNLWNKARNGEIAGLTALTIDEAQSAEFVKKYQSKPIVVDSDSSKFDKSKFPQNYISYIRFVEENYDQAIILVSSHLAVRQAMTAADVAFTIIVPANDAQSKQEYNKRYIERESPEPFRDFIGNNWSEFTQSCINDEFAPVIVIKPNEYLSDIIFD